MEHVVAESCWPIGNSETNSLLVTMPPLQIRKRVAMAVKKAKRCSHLPSRRSMTVVGVEIGFATWNSGVASISSGMGSDSGLQGGAGSSMDRRVERWGGVRAPTGAPDAARTRVRTRAKPQVPIGTPAAARVPAKAQAPARDPAPTGAPAAVRVPAKAQAPARVPAPAELQRRLNLGSGPDSGYDRSSGGQGSSQGLGQASGSDWNSGVGQDGYSGEPTDPSAEDPLQDR